MTGQLLTGRQVADLLNVSNKTVLRWAQDGELPSIRLSNRAIRFEAAAIDEWLGGRRRGEECQPPRNGAAHPLPYPLSTVPDSEE